MGALRALWPAPGGVCRAAPAGTLEAAGGAGDGDAPSRSPTANTLLSLPYSPPSHLRINKYFILRSRRRFPAFVERGPSDGV